MTPEQEIAVDDVVSAGVIAADQRVLPEALTALADQLAATPSAFARVRLVATTECGTPPDLAGLCQACGRQIAEPVAGHKPGCDPFARARRVAVRTSRLYRLFRAAARGQV